MVTREMNVRVDYRPEALRVMFSHDRTCLSAFAVMERAAYGAKRKADRIMQYIEKESCKTSGRFGHSAR